MRRREEMSSSSYSLFIGDLSIYCTKEDVEKVFSAFGPIKEVRIKQDENTGKNLSYGFIDYVNVTSAINVLKSMNGFVLCGRPLRIRWACNKAKSELFRMENVVTESQPTTTSAVHVTYTTSQPNVFVTEETLRYLFGGFGNVVDATVKKAVLTPARSARVGFGFVHFDSSPAGVDSAIKAAAAMADVTIEGIHFKSCISKNLEQRLSTSTPQIQNREMTMVMPAAGGYNVPPSPALAPRPMMPEMIQHQQPPYRQPQLQQPLQAPSMMYSAPASPVVYPLVQQMPVPPVPYAQQQASPYMPYAPQRDYAATPAAYIPQQQQTQPSVFGYPHGTVPPVQQQQPRERFAVSPYHESGPYQPRPEPPQQQHAMPLHQAAYHQPAMPTPRPELYPQQQQQQYQHQVYGQVAAPQPYQRQLYQPLTTYQQQASPRHMSSASVSPQYHNRVYSTHRHYVPSHSVSGTTSIDSQDSKNFPARSPPSIIINQSSNNTSCSSDDDEEVGAALTQSCSGEVVKDQTEQVAAPVSPTAVASVAQVDDAFAAVRKDLSPPAMAAWATCCDACCGVDAHHERQHAQGGDKHDKAAAALREDLVVAAREMKTCHSTIDVLQDAVQQMCVFSDRGDY